MSGDAPPTLVKVGSGDYRPWHGGSLLELDSTQLLRALKAESFLAQDTLVGDCKVFVLPTVAEELDEPTQTQEAGAVPLKGPRTVQSRMTGAASGQLFIRVETPAPPAGESGARAAGM